MSQEKIKMNNVRKPDYKADGVAVWNNTDKNGKEYLAIKIVGMNTIHAFKNDGGEDQ